MRFIDQVSMQVNAGRGGDGMIAFRREAHVDRGGPSGGDGGDGGDIYFVGDEGTNTLLHLYYLKHVRGHDGVNGGRKNLYGARGEDTFIKVPVGTMVFDDHQNLIADIIDTQSYLIAKGGKGGRGNAKFKTSRNKAPRLNELGMPGQSINLELVLKVLADVGFVGKPNAGKSTTLGAISNAKPTIANYEFTTKVPQLGMVQYDDYSFVAADLPGLIEGASLGKGLGHTFLQHIERCRLIAHVIDFGTEDAKPLEAYEMINKELADFDENLIKRKQIVVANKSDLPNFESNWKEFEDKYPAIEKIAISALEHRDINKLKGKMAEALKNLDEIIFATEVKAETTFTYEADYDVIKNYEGDYDVTGSKVEYWYNRIPLTTEDNWRRFNQILKKMGVWEELVKKGVKDGDTVRIFSHEFSWSGRDI